MGSRWIRTVWWIAIVLVAVPLLGVKRPSGLGDVTDVRTWTYDDYTRVVVELSRSVRPRVERLPADPKANRPERLYLDLEGIWVGRRFEAGVSVGDGLLRDVRLGQNTLQRSRLVIDLESYGSHRLMYLDSPHRVVVDIYGPKKSERRPRTLDPGTDPAMRLSMVLRDVRKVVIDPGHGGEDPGAIGVGGLREKDVNLRLAHMLADDLRLRGFEVALSRETDTTLDLEERTAIAEAAGGDLFVSLHANAARHSRTRGLEIYYLEKEHKRHNLEVAARENGVPLAQVDSLQRTLAQLRVAEASVHSARLANLVHQRVVSGLQRSYRDMPDLGVKRGPFYVLFLSSMPAILVEAGFVTNRADAELLRSEKYLSLLSERIAEGLDGYRSSGTQLAGGGDW